MAVQSKKALLVKRKKEKAQKRSPKSKLGCKLDRMNQVGQTEFNDFHVRNNIKTVREQKKVTGDQTLEK